MFAAVASLALLGAALGFGLGIAARRFAVESDSLVDALVAMMPGSNCGQCGQAGCAEAARLIAEGTAPVTSCPPGGKALASALAAKLGIPLDLSTVADQEPRIASIAEDICIGCCRCIKVCPTDAVIGAAKQIHAVIREACTGCGACIERCPTEAATLQPLPATVSHWVWPKPDVPAYPAPALAN
ncbi:RnfABCDGE type electron transport complex subunit B [Propionivibrio soli]|uniref:RnfABCDGE type electron transport complex subunit B n=1 Tax=Propionivibrio soli TaxID=2976531 RepID=UPI0021E8E435|nr:RnfABCDGE type electron transport complex subunit B [Propionivibrio soli]